MLCAAAGENRIIRANRALNAAARFSQDAFVQALLRPIGAGVRYEQRKRFNRPSYSSDTFAEARCVADTSSARRPYCPDATATCGAERRRKRRADRGDGD